MKTLSMAFLTLLTSFLIPCSFANTSDNPKCPTPSEIMVGGIQDAEKRLPVDGYVAFKVSRYGTPYTWELRMIMPSYYVKSREDALTKARAALQTITAQNLTPIQPAPNFLQCVYHVTPNVYAVDAIATRS